MKRHELLAIVAMVAASCPAAALGGLKAPTRKPPKVLTHADAERLAKAEAKRQRKAAQRKGATNG